MNTTSLQLHMSATESQTSYDRSYSPLYHVAILDRELTEIVILQFHLITEDAPCMHWSEVSDPVKIYMHINGIGCTNVLNPWLTRDTNSSQFT